MADIYQKIWDADLNDGAGLKAYVKGTNLTAEQKAKGYILVDENPTQGNIADHQLLPEVEIPAGKKKSYELVAALFNNYVLDQTKADPILQEEDAEVQAFLSAAVKSPSHLVARDYLQSVIGQPVSEDQWWAMVERIWFERFDMGNSKNLSGFEHVIVGEQKQGKVQGYHFWFKYYLDERFEIPNEVGTTKDLIKVMGMLTPQGDNTPDVATLKYKWNAFDYLRGTTVPLTKPIGGFWVGPSAEALLAIGTIAFLPQAQAPGQAVINGYKYNLRVFAGATPRNLRTCYPEFAGRVN